MTTGWEPEKYTDDYREALKGMIEEKIEHGDKVTSERPRKKKPSNVVDLVSILQKSIEETGRGTRTFKGKTKIRTRSHTSSKRKKAA